MKIVISRKGLKQTPVKLRYSILSYAENRLELENEREENIRQYLEWVPFSFLLLTIIDMVRGKQISLRPVIDI